MNTSSKTSSSGLQGASESVTISVMKKIDNRGSINVLLIPFVLVIVFFLGSLGFGFWAFTSRQDYKENVDEKIATAVDVAKKQAATEKDNEFIEREKRPLKEYAGPDAYGSINVKYPKTWSAYVVQGTGTAPLDGYFHPNFVPDDKSGASYALRVQVVNKTFDATVRQFDGNVKAGKTKAKPYKPANVDNVVGLRLTGQLENQQQGTMVLLQLRDKTIKIWTEGDQYEKDFVDSILANLTFIP